MTWIQNIEQKRTLLVGGVIAICVAALAVTARRNPVSFDSYWHLQTGLDWIHKGLSPWIDHFSFTFAGEPISSQPVMFQALLALLVDSFGLESGYQVIKLIAFALAFGLMIVYLRKLKSSALAYLLVLPSLTLLLELRSIVRPELFSYSFLIVAVMLYHRTPANLTWARLLPIALLLLVWTNYHASTLGYIVFFGLFVDAALLQVRDKASLKDWANWAAMGLLLLGVGFLNKGFHHPMIDAFLFAPEWRDYIQEYRSAGTFYFGIAGIYALAAIVLFTLFLAARQRRFGYLVVILVLTYFSLRMSRLLVPSGIVVLCFLASLLSETDLEEFQRRRREVFMRWAGVFSGFVILASLYSLVTLARDYMRENRTSFLSRPESIVYYMQDRQWSGRIFNEYGTGGYLIYALGSDSTVYIDGRTNILYPPEHYARFLQARNIPQVLAEEIEKYDIDYVLLETDSTAYSVAHESGLLGLDFADYSFSLFTRKDPGFPTAGRLLANPACWEESDAPRLQDEQVAAIMNLPGNSSLLPNLGFMASYSGNSDRAAFLEAFAASAQSDSMQTRFAAYQALALDQYDTAVQLLGRLDEWGRKEYLAAAMAYAKLEQWERAEETVDALTRVSWPYVDRSDLLLLYRLLETISQHGPLKSVAASYVDSLKDQVGAMGESISEQELKVSLLCPA